MMHRDQSRSWPRRSHHRSPFFRPVLTALIEAESMSGRRVRAWNQQVSRSSDAAARSRGKACASKSVAESPDCAPVARLRPRVQNEQLGVRRGEVQNDGMGTKIQRLAPVQSLGPSDPRATAGGTDQSQLDELFAGSR